MKSEKMKGVYGEAFDTLYWTDQRLSLSSNVCTNTHYWLMLIDFLFFFYPPGIHNMQLTNLKLLNI